MKAIRAAAVLVVGLALTPVVVKGADQRSARTANQPATSQKASMSQQDAQMIQRAQAMQSQLEKEEQLLRKHLAYAEQLRKRGLDQDDGKLLKQAEQIERQAVVRYQQTVTQLEQIGGSSEKVTTPAAKPAGGNKPAGGKKPASGKKPAVAPAPAARTAARPPSKSQTQQQRRTQYRR